MYQIESLLFPAYRHSRKYLPVRILRVNRLQFCSGITIRKIEIVGGVRPQSNPVREASVYHIVHKLHSIYHEY